MGTVLCTSLGNSQGQDTSGEEGTGWVIEKEVTRILWMYIASM